MAASAQQLRHQIEDALAHRIPAALSPAARMARPVAPFGVEAIDTLLEGGLPAGAISELTGPASSGRVTLAMAFVAGQTRAGQVCAWVDASDGLDPRSAEASGITLDRLLWVRCGGSDAQQSAATAVTATGSKGSRYGVARTRETGTVCGGPHPRSEARGMAQALEGMLGGAALGFRNAGNQGKPGTPGAMNRPLLVEERPSDDKVQIATDRLPARRGGHALDQKERLAAGETGVIPLHPTQESLAGHANLLATLAPRCAETAQGLKRSKPAQVIALAPAAMPLAPRLKTRPRPQWDRLDQAVRATDLLLQGGGFGALVLDLSGIEAEFANRITLATWFRFRAAADRTRTSLLVLTQHPCTGSSGEVLLRVQAQPPAGNTVIQHVPLHVEVLRQRYMGSGLARPGGNVYSIRKPPQRATAAAWSAPTASLRQAGLTYAGGAR